MTLRSKARDLLENTNARQQIAGQGQAKFIQNVMQWEEVDYDEAVRICTGQTDPIIYEYTLGYKLADPIWSVGIFQQPGAKARARAAANFRKQLCPEEEILFDEHCRGKTGRQVRKQFKKEMKAAKKQHKDVDVSELEGDDDGLEES